MSEIAQALRPRSPGKESCANNNLSQRVHYTSMDLGRIWSGMQRREKEREAGACWIISISCDQAKGSAAGAMEWAPNGNHDLKLLVFQCCTDYSHRSHHPGFGGQVRLGGRQPDFTSSPLLPSRSALSTRMGKQVLARASTCCLIGWLDFAS